MINTVEKLASLKSCVASGDMTIETLQRVLSQMLLSTELPDVEKNAKRFDNDLELVVYTLTPSNQVGAALAVLDEVEAYLLRK